MANHYHHGTGTTERGYVKTLFECFHPLTGDSDLCDKSYDDVDVDAENPIGKRTRVKKKGVLTIETKDDGCFVCSMRSKVWDMTEVVDGWSLEVTFSWGGRPSETHQVAVYTNEDAMKTDAQFVRNVWGSDGLVSASPLYIVACSACNSVGLVPERPPEGAYATCPMCTKRLAQFGHTPDAGTAVEVQEVTPTKTVEDRLADRGFAVVREDLL